MEVLGRQARLQKPMPATKNFIFRRLQLVRLRGWNSFQWLLSVAALGMPGPWRFCTMWHVRLPPALAKIRPHAPASCSNSSVSPFGRTGLERRCGAAVLCFKQPGSTVVPQCRYFKQPHGAVLLVRSLSRRVPIESRRCQHGRMSSEPLWSQWALQTCREGCLVFDGLPAIFAPVFSNPIKGAWRFPQRASLFLMHTRTAWVSFRSPRQHHLHVHSE